MKKNILALAVILAVSLAIENTSYAQSAGLEIKTSTIQHGNFTTIEKKEPSRVANNTYVPNSVTIDKTKSVGEIPFSTSVSPTGAVTYNVPIEVYPGQHGMQPQLSVVYNSMGGNGIMGVGWNISGLSSISRSNKNMYYDGTPKGITMTKDDAFYLDGMRLIKLSETTTQIKYESEHGNIKVTANLNGTVVKYFDVYYPNGTKGTYGYTTNTGTSYLEYPLITLSDLYGNTITYTYTYIDNHYRINKISYANALVEFEYETISRPDMITSYSGGLKIKEDKRLQKIVCKYGTTVLRNYEFTYTLQKNTSLLTQIGYSAASSSFNPLKFYYGENNTATVYNNSETQIIGSFYGWTDPNAIRVSRGKFNYGTEDDGLIVLPEKNPYLQNNNDFSFSYQPTEKIFLYMGLSDPIVFDKYTTTGAGFVDIFCADVDGKREEEVIQVNNVVSGSNDQIIFNVYSTNLYSGLATKYIRTFNFPTLINNKSIQPKYYFTGDFNGDGKMEVLAVSCHQPFSLASHPTKCYLFDLESNTKLYEGQAFAYNVTFGNTQSAFNNTDRLFAFDYDGDGKTDICLINSSGTYIYSFNVSGSTYSLTQTASYTGLTRADIADKQLMVGELNGDGKPDFLLSPKVDDAVWYIYYSMGNGQFEKVAVMNRLRSSTAKYCLQDVNSDGLTDLIEYSSTGFGTMRAISGGFSVWESYITFDYQKSIIVPTNINSRYFFSQLIALKDGKIVKYSYPCNYTKEKLLTGAVSSLGIVGKNYYRMLNESYGLYIQGSDATYPYENFQGALFVTECREQYFNGAKNEDLTYIYENAVIHKQGLGFRGFGKIITLNNIRSRMQYQKFDPYNFGVLEEEDSPAAKNTYSYSFNVASNKIAKVQMTNRIAQNKLTGTTVTAAYTYDSYGSPLTETINYGGGITETVSNAYFNNTNETGYLLGFLTDRTKTVNRNGATWSERYYTPAYSNGQPSVVYRYANGNQVSYETFAYSTKGNNTSHGVKSYSSTNTLTTDYTYDSYGRVTSKTDPVRLKTMYEYNATNGNLSQVKNHREQATNYAYDSFGRQTSASYPEGTTESVAFSWMVGGTNGLYRVQNSSTIGPVIRTYYDALGRETRISQTQFNGAESHSDKLYDSYGRLQKVSLPFTGTSASFWNQYAYDSYDRPTSITEASGRITSCAYSNNSVTITKDGIASTKTFDTQGNMTQVSDPGGTITYNFRPDGQPSSIVAPGSVTTSFTYDAYGRQLTIVDPSAGTQTYTYDIHGNIETEKDANNKTITYGYDSYRRLTSKAMPEFTASYSYNAYGQLASETSTNGTSTTLTYDTYGRLQKRKETAVDGKWLEKTYAYASGNLASTQYTSQTGSIVTENYSYANGALTEIKLNGTTSIWKLNEVNNFGQPTAIATGSFNRSYGYSSYGLPTSRKVGTYQDFSYSFDAVKGNLSYRKDNGRNKQEDFTYDNLNRLKTYSEYDNKGNLTGRSDVGGGASFMYETPGKPYAISKVYSSSNDIPLREQTLTYTSFKRPSSITEGEYTAAFTYNGNGNRVKMELKKNGAKDMNRYYLSDCYEIDDKAVGGIKEKLYLGGDFYTAPAVYVKEGSGNWNIYYICRDYLGSITHIMAAQELSYDAWGRLRNPVNQQVYAPGSEPELFLGRGYTGHEHLPQFGLINMNARLYDPVLGRFLSPDPFVQAFDFSQSFNRYSYCLNNPLIYVDENGEFWHIIFGALVGGVINWATHGCHFTWEGLSYFGVGAAAGASVFVGGPLAPALAGGITGAGNSFVSQGFAGGNGNTWSWNNIDVGQIALNGVTGAITGYAGGQIAGKIAPYISQYTSILGGPVIQDMVTNSLTSGATGFTIGAGWTALNGGSFEESMQVGWGSAKVGLVTGAASGVVSGFQRARAENVNWLTGKDKQTYEIGDGIRRAKIAEMQGQKTIKAELNDGTEIDVSIKNLRSPMKNEIDISNSANYNRFNNLYNDMLINGQKTPIYISPGNRGVIIKDIKFKW